MTKRAFIVGDIHIGVRAGSKDWQNITESYFNDFLIPLLKERSKSGDILIQLGDVFDNRQSLNIRVQYLAIKYFEIISKILPTYIIAGNHDCFNKSTNEISSLECLKFIPNIHIYKEPTVIDFGKAKCLMLPWCSSPEMEVEYLSNFNKKADYVFSHSEMRGLMLNRKVKQEHGTDIDEFSSYKKVYSGHIHYSQIKNNIIMAGNAYQMTRSDCDNKKGVYILDFETNEHEFIENTHSPKFVKLNLSNILDMPIGEIKKMMHNNFVDLYIASDIPIKYNLSGFMAQVQSEARKIEPNIYDEKTYIDIENINEEIQNGYKNFNIINLCSKFVEGMNVDPGIKDKMNKQIMQLYNECINNYKTDEN